MGSIHDNDKCGDNEGTKDCTDNHHCKEMKRDLMVQDEKKDRGNSE